MNTNTQRKKSQQRQTTEKLSDMRRSARDEFCSGPKFPGKPEDYSYVVSGRCQRRPSTLSDAEMKKKKEEGQARSVLKKKNDARELNVLRKEIQKKYGEEYIEGDMDGMLLGTAVNMFAMMIDVKVREKFPDPLVRYDMLSKRVDDAQKQNRGGITADKLPRFTILSLTLEHLSVGKTQ